MLSNIMCSHSNITMYPMMISALMHSQDLDEIEFRFKDKEKPISYAVSLTRSLNVSLHLKTTLRKKSSCQFGASLFNNCMI